jgi:hypothetical protein
MFIVCKNQINSQDPPGSNNIYQVIEGGEEPKLTYNLIWYEYLLSLRKSLIKLMNKKEKKILKKQEEER